MLPSLHDDLLISYEVNCEARELRLFTRRSDLSCLRTIIFSGVKGYHLKNDAFGNIIFSLAEIHLDQFLAEYGEEISESYRLSGAPGPWAADADHGLQSLMLDDVKAFVLSSSYGISAWLLAKSVTVLQTL
jgi:hypothetical protein